MNLGPFAPHLLNFPFILQIVNQHLLKDLTERGLWNETLKNKLVAANGSIQVCFIYSNNTLVQRLVNVFSPERKWSKSNGCVTIA